VAILKFPGGYCWGYTKWVYQRRSPKPASQGGPWRWYGELPTGRPSCWKAHGGTGRRRLWRIQRQAHGGLPYSTRHCIGLSLGLHIVSAPISPTVMPMPGAFISRRGGALEALRLRYGQSHSETANLIIVTKHLLPYSDL
jgi:hypothetical protein